MRLAGLLVVVAVTTAHAQPRIEGQITIARARNNDAPGTSAEAVFTTGSAWGTEIGTDGPCTAYKHRARDGLSAGTITITGTAQPITLEPMHATRYTHTGDLPKPAFVDGATITVSAAGGPDIPAFTASVTAPPALTGYLPPKRVSRAGHIVRWTANPGTEIMIMVGAFSPRTMDGAFVVCRVPDTGEFTVPASTLALLPLVFDHSIVTVGRIAEQRLEVGGTNIAVQVVSAISAGPFAISPHPRELAIPVVTSPSRFLSLAFGLGGVSRNGDAPPMFGSSARIQFGARLGDGLHLVADVNFIGPGIAYPIFESHSAVGVGVRWTPFEPKPRLQLGAIAGPYFDPKAFYLTAVLGADQLDRVTQTSPTDSTGETAWSPMASLAVGWMGKQGRDWALGPEFREQLAYFDGHLQRGWMTLVAIHLNE